MYCSWKDLLEWVAGAYWLISMDSTPCVEQFSDFLQFSSCSIFWILLAHFHVFNSLYWTILRFSPVQLLLNFLDSALIILRFPVLDSLFHLQFNFCSIFFFQFSFSFSTFIFIFNSHFHFQLSFSFPTFIFIVRLFNFYFHPLVVYSVIVQISTSFSGCFMFQYWERTTSAPIYTVGYLRFSWPQSWT